jgi:hypothetical protein
MPGASIRVRTKLLELLLITASAAPRIDPAGMDLIQHSNSAFPPLALSTG